MALREFWQAEFRAGEVIQQHNIVALPVDPFGIAKKESILCQEFGLVRGICG